MPALLLAALKKANSRFLPTVKKTLRSDESKEVFAVIELLQGETSGDVTVDDLLLGIDRSYPEKKATVLKAFIGNWKSIEYNPELMETYLKSEQERAIAYDVALKGLEVYEGRAPFSSLVMPEIESSGSADYSFVPTDLKLLKGLQEDSGGLPWRLAAMNELLGRVPRQTLGCVFARPECGKTTFFASEVSWMAYKSQDPVIVIANEEPAERVTIRYMQALFKVSEAELFKDLNKYQALWDKHIGNRLLISGDPMLSKVGHLEQAMGDLNPCLVVIDQVSNLTGLKESERLDLLLGSYFKWLRKAAKNYNCAIIGVHQAGGSAENQKWLGMNDMMNSHTEIQAPLDWICGIGMTRDTGTSRFLHTSKDKLPRTNGRNPADSHGFKEVLIEADVARFVDLGKAP